MKIWKKLSHSNTNGLDINNKHPIERYDQNTYNIFNHKNVMHVHCKTIFGKHRKVERK